MTRHISAELLARYRAGDLGVRRSARVSAHLAGCQRCAATDDGLAAVSSVLASAPVPPMPASVTARIEAALAAETATRAAAGSPGTAGAGAGTAGTGAARDAVGGHGAGPRRPAHRGPGRADRPGQRGRSWWPGLQSPAALRGLAAAGLLVVVIGGAFTAAKLAGGGGSAGSASSSSAGTPRGAASGSAASPEEQPRAIPGPLATHAPLTYQANGRTATFTPLTTGTRFRPGRLSQQVTGLLEVAGMHQQGSTSPSATTSPAPAGVARTPVAGIPASSLQGCVSRVAAGGHVRLVDIGRYQGQRAIVIVVAPAGGGPSRIWVVGTGCSASGSDVITETTLGGAG